MGLYAGIDGGGTKTSALLYDSKTLEMCLVIGDASRTSAVGFESSCDVVTHLLHSGLANMHGSVREFAGISVCMSGIDLPWQEEKMKKILASAFPGATVEVANDSMAALTAGTKGNPGTVLVVGTGSITMGEDDSGKIARAGGYGSLIGDEGSGFAIGRAGLMAAIQSYEVRGQKTILWEMAQNFYQIRDSMKILPVIYDSANPIREIAAFAPIVIDHADDDCVAGRIISEAVSDYVRLIQSVHQKLHQQANHKVILSGGIMTYGDVVVTRLRALASEFSFAVLDRDPVIGALFRAVRLCRMAPSDEHGFEQIEQVFGDGLSVPKLHVEKTGH